MISRLFNVARDCAGAVLVEFALTVPMLLVVLLGVLQFGIFYYDYVALTDATAAGAREFSLGRLDATTAYDTVAAIENASCNPSSGSCILHPSNLTITLSVNGTPCAGSVTGSPTDASQYNSACQTALASAYSASPPQPISVTVSYSCTSLMPVGWVNLGGICPLTMTLMQRAQ